MKFNGTITHLSQKGLGVVKNDQNKLSYFVYGTWPGDIGEFEALDKILNNKKFAYAKLVQLIQPSPHRQQSACAYADLTENACTGCPWMMADYTSQLEQKKNRFVYAMKRVGFDEQDFNIAAIFPSDHTIGYRNRCQVKTDGAILGFVSENSYQIAPIQDCIVLNDDCRTVLKNAIGQLPNASWQSTLLPEQKWHFIELDDDMSPHEMSINEKKPFKQGNTLQNERMKSWLKERLAKNVTLQKVVELFCGSGNFTEIIAQSNCTSVIAYESDESAIQALQHKQLPKVTAHTYDLFKPFAWRDLQKNGCEADTLVLDPPRSGLKKHSGFFTAFAALKTIDYISCNPETFARDAWFFKQNGWMIHDLQLIDLFPHTPHIEILAEFRKN